MLFFKGEWWNRGCWCSIFSWLFEISDVYFQPVPRNLIGLKGVIPGTLHGHNAMGRKNVRRRRHRVLVKFVQCKAEIAPQSGKRFWMRWISSWKELKVLCNQIPRNWICCEWDSGNFRWSFMTNNAFGLRVKLDMQSKNHQWPEWCPGLSRVR